MNSNYDSGKFMIPIIFILIIILLFILISNNVIFKNIISTIGSLFVAIVGIFNGSDSDSNVICPYHKDCQLGENIKGGDAILLNVDQSTGEACPLNKSSKIASTYNRYINEVKKGNDIKGTIKEMSMIPSDNDIDRLVVIHFIKGCNYCSKLKDAWEEMNNDKIDWGKNIKQLIGKTKTAVITIDESKNHHDHINNVPSILKYDKGKCSPDIYTGEFSPIALKKWIEK